MPELEEAEHNNVDASREWLKRASVADPDPVWLCNDCGNAAAEWEPICTRCEKFDTLEWKIPPRVTRIDSEIATNTLNHPGSEIMQTLDNEDGPDHLDIIEPPNPSDQGAARDQKEK